MQNINIRTFFEWILVLICFNIHLREVILASIDHVLSRVSTLAYAFNRSKNNFGEIHLLLEVFLLHHFLLLEIKVAKESIRRTA